MRLVEKMDSCECTISMRDTSERNRTAMWGRYTTSCLYAMLYCTWAADADANVDANADGVLVLLALRILLIILGLDWDIIDPELAR